MSSPSETNQSCSYPEALREAVEQEMERDPSVFVLGLDVDDHVAIQGSTRGLAERFGPDRVIATPLSEDAMTGVAIGAAIAGLRPIHVHIRMDFLMLCMNQIVNMAAKARYMFGGAVQVPMVVRAMIGKSWGQGPQHSQALHALFAHIPGLKVVAPSNPYDAKGCMIAAIRDNNPVIFVEHRLLYYTDAPVPDAAYEVRPGTARICAKGSDLTLVGISNMAVECLRAGELLGAKGVSAEVIDPIWLSPLDIDTIVASARKTRRVLVVDNAWTACGVSAEILAAIVERTSPNDGIVMERIGFAAVPCPTTPSLEDGFYPTPATIAAKAFAMVHPDADPWAPDPESAKLAYQMQFKGPF